MCVAKLLTPAGVSVSRLIRNDSTFTSGPETAETACNGRAKAHYIIPRIMHARYVRWFVLTIRSQSFDQCATDSFPLMLAGYAKICKIPRVESCGRLRKDDLFGLWKSVNVLSDEEAEYTINKRDLWISE